MKTQKKPNNNLDPLIQLKSNIMCYNFCINIICLAETIKSACVGCDLYISLLFSLDHYMNSIVRIHLHANIPNISKIVLSMLGIFLAFNFLIILRIPEGVS